MLNLSFRRQIGDVILNFGNHFTVIHFGCVHMNVPQALNIFLLVTSLGGFNGEAVKINLVFLFGCHSSQCTTHLTYPARRSHLMRLSSRHLGRYFFASSTFCFLRHISTNGSYPMGLFFDLDNFSSSSHWNDSANTVIRSHQNRLSGTLYSLFIFSACLMSPNSSNLSIVSCTERP